MWRKESLPVEFELSGHIQITKPNSSSALAPFFIQILPPGYTELACEVELDFITSEGMVLFPTNGFFQVVLGIPS